MAETEILEAENPEVEADNPAPNISDLQARIAQLESDNEKLRGANTRASADASKYKKELQARMSESEKETAEREEATRKLQERLAELERQNTVSTYVGAYVSMGYSAELAQKRAELMADGKIAEALEVEKEFLVIHDKELGATAVKSMSKPPMGTTKTLTKEEIMKMKDATARQKAIADNIELFE